MNAVDVELAHGYTLAQIDHLAKAAVNLSGTYASDYLDRLHEAHSAIIDALYTAEHWPARYDLIRTGATAVARLVEADLRSRGYRRGSGYNGAGSAPGFVLYWWGLSAPTPSPEDAIVERTAIRQIVGLLTPKQLAAVAALAATGNHDAAAKALGIARSTYTDRLTNARRTVAAWWHEGETPTKARPDYRAGSRAKPRPTHCPAGHEYTPDNLYHSRGRSPRCRTCQLLSKRKGYVAPPPRRLLPCGTAAAYRRHRRRGEPVDPACEQAYEDYCTTRRRQITEETETR